MTPRLRSKSCKVTVEAPSFRAFSSPFANLGNLCITLVTISRRKQRNSNKRREGRNEEC